LAFFNRDYRRVAELHLESGWVPPDTRLDHFESAIRTVCEPIFQKPISEISFGNLLLRLFQTARRFKMEVQPQLVLLQKTLLNIEGLGRQLDPDLDLWQTAKPFLDRWMSEQVGVHALIKGMKNHLPKILEQSPEIPALIYQALQTHNQNQSADTQLVQKIEKLERQVKHQKWFAVAFTTVMLMTTGAIIYLLT
jgi:ubiquinone biosynthesis protein